MTMKIINKDADRIQMTEVIQGLYLDLSPVVAWQSSAQNRVIYPVKISNVDNETDQLSFKATNNEVLTFTDDTIFFFSEGQSVLFKAHKTKMAGMELDVFIPEEMKILGEAEKEQYATMIQSFITEIQATIKGPSLDWDDDDDEDTIDSSAEGDASFNPSADFDSPEAKTIYENLKSTLSEHDANLLETELGSITLEEEDALYEGMRASPRAKPPEGKMVTVQISDESLGQTTHPLYDLSTGGLSFLVFSKDEFSVGQKLLVKAFDINQFENPLLTEVKVVREADDMGIQYKVGCQFIEP